MIKRLLIAAVLTTATLNLMAQDNNKANTEKKEKSTNEKRKIKLKQEYSTPSGLKYKLLEMGSGKKVTAGDMVTVHYTGTLPDGTKFDSSKDRNQPFSFKVGGQQVIAGWDEGLQLLQVGDKAILTIPAALGYGERAMGKIPANSTLIFEIEVLDSKAPVVAVPFNIEGKEVLTTPSGLKYVYIEKGNGPKAEAGKTVDVHYTGYLMDGRKFDSSVERGDPISFPLGQGMVIKGWEEGIALMKVGDKMRLIIPSELAYGPNGAGGVIPPNATLLFDVELVGVK
jgi:peptidylprolyl isomerase